MRAGVDQVCEWYPAAGTVQCQKMWNFGLGQYGGNDFGQYVASYTDPNIVNLVVGPFNLCVLLTTGNTKCWGEGAPAIEYAGGDAIAVSLSRGSACVVTRDGQVKCRSTVNANGIYHSTLDTWTVEYGPSGVDPTKGNPIPYTGKALWIVSGGQFHCFQTDANPDAKSLSCIGSTYANGAGASDANDYPTYHFAGTPAPVSSGSSYNICVLMQEGNVDCLPIYYNDNGYVSGPKSASAAAVQAIDLSGNGSTCALKPSGDIECWGSAFHYEYAVGYGNHYTISGKNAVAIGRSGGDLCWLDNVGSVRCMATQPGAVIATAPPVTQVDVTPPVIAPTITGTQGSNGWYTSDVSVGWSVTDAESTVSSTSGCGASSVTTNTAGTTFTCTATSAGGTATRSVIIKRDAQLPAISFTLTGTLSPTGWYTTNVGVIWTTTAGPSGVNLCSSAPVAADGTNITFSCTATAGNGLTASVTTPIVKRDATMPTVAYTGNLGTYTVDQAVHITCAASDALSGLASNTCANIMGDAYTFHVGANSYSATATDVAGNVGTASISFTVSVTTTSLCALAHRWVSGDNAEELCAKLAKHHWGAFARDVTDNANEDVTAAHAKILIDLVKVLGPITGPGSGKEGEDGEKGGKGGGGGDDKRP